MTLFQVVEQQSHALQSLMEKVNSITHQTMELTEKLKELRYLCGNVEEIGRIKGRLICSKKRRERTKQSRVGTSFKQLSWSRFSLAMIKSTSISSGLPRSWNYHSTEKETSRTFSLILSL